MTVRKATAMRGVVVVVSSVVAAACWPGLAAAETGVEGGFSDVGGVHAHGIEQVVQQGIDSGCGDGLFCSGEPISRAQMAAWLYRAVALLHDAPTPPPPPGWMRRRRGSQMCPTAPGTGSMPDGPPPTT